MARYRIIVEAPDGTMPADLLTSIQELLTRYTRFRLVALDGKVEDAVGWTRDAEGVDHDPKDPRDPGPAHKPLQERVTYEGPEIAGAPVTTVGENDGAVPSSGGPGELYGHGTIAEPWSYGHPGFPLPAPGPPVYHPHPIPLVGEPMTFTPPVLEHIEEGVSEIELARSDSHNLKFTPAGGRVKWFIDPLGARWIKFTTSPVSKPGDIMDHVWPAERVRTVRYRKGWSGGW